MATMPGPVSVTNSGALTLPLLKTDTRYHGMPKRYEETKPVIIQNFTHRYIMGLGEKFHRDSTEKFEIEKNIAVKSAEEALWARAEQFRQDSIEKALQKAKVFHEKELKKQKRTHEKILKDELFRLEQELTMYAAEQLKKEKEEGEKRLKEAVDKTERRCEEVKVRAVEQAKIEERQKSLQEIEDLKREFKEKYARAVEEWKEVKARALGELREELRKERELAVACAHHEEQVVAQETQAKLKQLHDQAVRVLKTHIAELKGHIEGLEKEIQVILKHKKFVEDEVLITRECFQQFIDDVKPFEPGKSDYVMPPMRMVRTDSVLEFDLHKKGTKEK